MPPLPSDECAQLKKDMAALERTIQLLILKKKRDQGNPSLVADDQAGIDIANEELAALTLQRAELGCDQVNPPKPAFLYVGDVSAGDKIFVFPLTANGNTPPVRTIAGDKTRISGPTGLAMDQDRNLYVSNAADASITVYAPDADGNVPPIRRIHGPNSSLSSPDDIDIDSNGFLYAVSGSNLPGDNRVTVYEPAADGDPTPVRMIKGLNTGLGQTFGMKLDQTGDVVVINFIAPNNILAFSPDANGDVPPARIVSGKFTMIDGVGSCAFDSENNLYVTNGSPPVLVFGPKPNGNIPPLRTLSQPASPLSIAVDRAGNTYIGDFNGFIAVFSASSTVPDRTIQGSATGLRLPGAMLVEDPS